MCRGALPDALHGDGRPFDVVDCGLAGHARLPEDVVGGGAARCARIAVVDGSGLWCSRDLPDVLREAHLRDVGLGEVAEVRALLGEAVQVRHLLRRNRDPRPAPNSGSRTRTRRPSRTAPAAAPGTGTRGGARRRERDRASTRCACARTRTRAIPTSRRTRSRARRKRRRARTCPSLRTTRLRRPYRRYRGSRAWASIANVSVAPDQPIDERVHRAALRLPRNGGVVRGQRRGGARQAGGRQRHLERPAGHRRSRTGGADRALRNRAQAGHDRLGDCLQARREVHMPGKRAGCLAVGGGCRRTERRRAERWARFAREGAEPNRNDRHYDRDSPHGSPTCTWPPRSDV